MAQRPNHRLDYVLYTGYKYQFTGLGMLNPSEMWHYSITATTFMQYTDSNSTFCLSNLALQQNIKPEVSMVEVKW